MHAVNVFSTFGQEENNFTNGLFALLRISAYEKPDFVKSFLKDLLGITPTGKSRAFSAFASLKGLSTPMPSYVSVTAAFALRQRSPPVPCLTTKYVGG